MNKANLRIRWGDYIILTIFLLTASCSPATGPRAVEATPQNQSSVGEPVDSSSIPTPLPTRPSYAPGELVDYVAQSGDTLPALAKRFNTSVDEILAANSQVPRDASTMPPGMPMKIPIYYRALWGSPFQIIPDHAFVYGPSSTGFNTAAFVSSQTGWLKDYRSYVGGEWKSGAELVDYVATNYSINPKLLLAILEYQGGALSMQEPPVKKKLLGLERTYWETPYLQLVLAANTLNDAYYGWRIGGLIEFEDTAGILIRPDPWQNAASAALQFYYSRMFSGSRYADAIGYAGLSQTYKEFFGDPWTEELDFIPGSLRQPELILPFPSDQTWNFTGGPHTGWGTGEPFAAVDFAPPSEKSGCVPAKPENFATAVADGLVVRSSVDGVALDLDKDGNERTGWVILYLHLATQERAPLGADLKAGDKIGYPSCEGGRSTGTHVHIARKYNGEWIVADSAIPFTLSGWNVHRGSEAYLGTFTRGGSVVIACECADAYTSINAAFP